MKLRSKSLTALSLAAFLVVTAGCGSSAKSPTSPLLDASAATSLMSSVRDTPGDAMRNHHSNDTNRYPRANQLAPPLGAAGAFVVLAGSTVTNTGLTTVTGDLGVSPGTAVTGFPPGIVYGAKHAADPASAKAMNDLTIAYNNAAGRTNSPILIAGNLGGLTLAPGLYKSTSSLEISSGDLTLDAKGNPNAVFIFQMASTLNTTPGRAVILKGGASAANIYWQVGSSATIGTTSAFKGTIMADQSISLNAGATLVGRALARIGAVTLNANAIVRPAR